MKHRYLIIPGLSAALMIMLLLSSLRGVQSAATGAISPSAQGTGETERAEITSLSAGPDIFSFNLELPALDAGFSGDLEIAGLNGRLDQPGAPDLPYYSTFIALPPGASAELLLEPGEPAVSPNMTIAAVPDPQSAAAVQENDENLAAVNEAALEVNADAAVYQRDANFPGALYELSEPMYVRDIRLVKLNLFPLQFNPVSQELTQYRALEVTIRFNGGQEEPGQRLEGQSPFSQSLDGLILNAEQAQNWRGLPENLSGGGTMLPVGSDAYKIAVEEDGIYEVTYAGLQAAGMNVNSVNPNTFQMLYRGETVAYEFIGDGDTQFEAGEKVRFYGWAFNGSRLEKQFINENVFWLWAGGTPDTVSLVASQNGFPVAPNFRSSVTEEPETIWYPSWTDQWDLFPNEPDAWYWVRLTKPSAAPLTTTINLPLLHPAASGPEADITAEFSSKLSPIVNTLPISHEIKLKVNGHPDVGYKGWIGKQNVNVTTDIPMPAVINGTNSFAIGMHTAAVVGSASQALYLNRITVDYTRLFIATDDQLIFGDEVGGSREFNIAGYSQNNTANIIVWDITNPTQPLKVTGVSVSGGGPAYTYEFGTNHSAGAKFIATTQGNALAPVQISRYDVPNIEPSGGADWVAVAYDDFVAETQSLANHRENALYGGHDTHVVDIEDIVNQYGYGLPIPAAVQDYMSHGLADWQLPPAYLLLVGDATIDPHMNTWIAPQYLMTDLPFVDRYQGQIPSDHAFSMLVGNDILPDIAVGRITAQTPEQAAAVVEKIIIYDQNQLLPSSWMNDIVFVSDNADTGGNFCAENDLTATHIPDAFQKSNLCLPDNPTTADAENLRAQLFSHINTTGTLLLNYRGHGAINTWASGPIILDQTHVNSWNNPVKPVVAITGDCLDGFFAYPVLEGLGETFLRADGKGTAAHWSSSGLGLTNEHSLMVDFMYDGLYLEGLTTLGDASNFAKVQYDLFGGHRSLVYSFVLEGDPAMHLMRPNLTIVKSALDDSGAPGQTAEFLLDISNLGLYPSRAVVTDTLPPELNYVSFQSDISATATVAGNDVIFNLQFGTSVLNGGIPRNESAEIILITQVDGSAAVGTVTNSAVVGGSGFDTQPGNNDDSALFNIIFGPILDFLNYMPVVRKV